MCIDRNRYRWFTGATAAEREREAWPKHNFCRDGIIARSSRDWRVRDERRSGGLIIAIAFPRIGSELRFIVFLRACTIQFRGEGAKWA